MDRMKAITAYSQIEDLNSLIKLIQAQMCVIGGNSDYSRIKAALKNALKVQSRSVLFLWFSENMENKAFAFANVCAGLETGSDYLWINEIHVDAEFRGRKIASSLLKFIESWSRENGIKYIACITELDNESAKRLYAKNDFGLSQALWVDKYIE